MPTVAVYNMEGARTGETEVKSPLEGAPNESVVHQAVVAYLAGQRAGTADTRTRAQVRGGGKKPWRQKGTGRARQGSRRAPHWRGGGVVFGPHPRSYAQRLPKKMKDLALRSAFADALESGRVKVFESLQMDAPSARSLVLALEAAGAERRVLLVAEDLTENLVKSSRSLPGVTLCLPQSVNAFMLLRYPDIFFTSAALAKFQERWESAR